MMWMLSQIDAAPVDLPIQHDVSLRLISGAFALFWLLSTIFWIWMLYHCIRYETDKYLWLFILIFVPFFGPIIYFLARWLPASQVETPASLKRFTRRRQLDQLQAAAEQIGNAHQFVCWGDALREVQDFEKARAAYEYAIRKEPENLQALWGLSLIADRADDSAQVKELTAEILKHDPQYKFGDVSMLHGKALFALDEHSAAEEHLTSHVRRWRHPEALYLLAVIAERNGRAAEARSHLQALLMDINSSPKAIARKHLKWKSKARRLLARLPHA